MRQQQGVSVSVSVSFVVAVVLLLVAVLLDKAGSADAAFVHPSHHRRVRHSATTTSTVVFGKTRKARKTQKAEQSRPKNFFDAIDDANDLPVDKKKSKKKSKKEKSKLPEPDAALTKEQQERQDRIKQEAQERMEQRPDVSTMIVDDETGIEVVAQGKNVMDVVTRKAVQLSSLGPEYRLAQMFPGVPMDVREKYRYDWEKKTSIPDVVQQLQEAASVTLPDGTRDIPPHPSLSNNAIDFVLANRDMLGRQMKETLGRMQMRAMSLGNKEEALQLLKLCKNYMTLENHISAPFRQILMDAEGRVGPNFGNLDVKTYCNGELYERTANYLVLKGMVAHWEKKVVDADYTEKTKQTKENYITVLSRGDPRRYLPDPPILFTLKECTQVCAMSQQMTKAFVDTPELFDDLPVEVRFLELALTIKGGTALRKFVSDEFCPAEGITPDALREGLRRLSCQLENMQIDPYADITNILNRLITAMSVGTDEAANDPYLEYFYSKNNDGPGSFQTYTFNHEKLSLVRFLDSQYENQRGGGGGGGSPELSTPSIDGLFNLGAPQQQQQQEPQPQPSSQDEGEFYKVPKARAAGRPHNLGWLDMLNDELEADSLRLGKVPPGKIIMED